MELKFQFMSYMKGRYNASVMHHTWIPYSNGFMLKNIFKIEVFFLINTISNLIAGFTTYSISTKKIMYILLSTAKNLVNTLDYTYLYI